MSDKGIRIPVTQAVWGYAVIVVTGSLLPSASTADVPRLDEIKARVKQQRDKIQSLYVEVKEEHTSPLSPEEFQKLPSRARRISPANVEIHFGFKGDKRYSRKQVGEMSDLARPPKPRPLPFGQEKDSMTGYNGKLLWTRKVIEVKHRDGRVQQAPPQVQTLSPNNLVSRLIAPPKYLSHVGLAVLGPDFATQNKAMQDLLRAGVFPEAFDLGKYSVKGTEEIDGAKCVVVSGAHEIRSPAITFRQKIWLDLDRGLSVRKRETIVPQRKSHEIVLLSQFKERAPDFWLPGICEIQQLAPPDDPDYPKQVRGAPIRITRITLTKCLVNKVPDDLFDVLVKPGDRVQDVRGPLKPGRR